MNTEIKINRADTVETTAANKSNFKVIIPDTVQISGDNVDGGIIVAALMAAVLIVAILGYVTINKRKKSEHIEIVKITRTMRN